MPVSRSLSRTLPALVAGVMLAAGLSACSGNATRDSSSEEITSAGAADVFSLRVGDCFNDVSQDQVSDVPGVPCTTPHDNEVYYLFQMPDGDFPGEAAIDAAVEESCLPEFESYVGIPYADSTLDYFPLTPTEASWNGLKDREVVCSVYDPAGQTTGTLKGAAR